MESVPPGEWFPDVLKDTLLPRGWIQLEAKEEYTLLIFCYVKPGSANEPACSINTVKVMKDHSWTVFAHDHILNNPCDVLTCLPDKLNSVESI